MGRLGNLSTLYVTQYLGIGFITVGLTAILRAGGTSLDTLALLTVIGVIWPLKFLWAPLIDRYSSYRSWLFVLQTGMVLALLTLLPFTDPVRHLGAVVAVCAAYVLLSATQDIAVDAVAVRLLDERARGTGNGVQVAASYAGNLIGGGLCVVVYDRFGWVAAVLLLAALTATGLIAIRAYREPRRTDPRATYRELFSVLARPGCRQWAFGVTPLLYVGAGAAYALVSPALVDAGWSLERIGVVTGIVISVPAILAGLAAGGLTGRIGRAGVLAGGGAALVVSIALLMPLLTSDAPAVATIVALGCFTAAYTVINVVLYTVNMDYSRPGSGGTDFTVLSSIGLICSFVAASAGLAAADRVGYPAVAVAAAVLVVFGVALGLAHQRRHHPATPPILEPTGQS